MNSVYARFISKYTSGSHYFNKEILFNAVKEDVRTTPSAYRMVTHSFDQYFLVIPCGALLQVEKHEDGRIIAVIDYPRYGYFDYDSNPQQFLKYLKLF